MPDLAGPKVAYVTFSGLIDSVGTSKIAAALNGAANEQYDEVYICMSTPGGYVGDGIFLYNHVRSLPLQVTFHNTGTVASIGATLFTAAGRRLCSPNGLFMMHPVSIPADGHMSPERIQALLAAAQADEARTQRILRERTNIPDPILASRSFTDVYLTAEDALKYGLVTEVGDFVLPPGNQIFHL